MLLNLKAFIIFVFKAEYFVYNECLLELDMMANYFCTAYGVCVTCGVSIIKIWGD